MENTDYYKYYEILFSLRKEYLKNQEIINKLLSYVHIDDNIVRDYIPNLIFHNNGGKKDSLLLIISKRQSHIKLLFNSLYHSIVQSNPILEQGNYLYAFRLTDNYIYLLDGNQDGRYLNSNVSIVNHKEFIELYELLMENLICKKANTNLKSDNTHVQLSNNGIHLLYYLRDIHKRNMVLDYDGIGDHIRTNNTSYINDLMELKIKKEDIPDYFRMLIDHNMEDYLYLVEGQTNKKKEYYEIEDYDKKLVLRSNRR